MTTGRNIVMSALERLKTTVSPDDARAFEDTNLEKVWQTARDIENEQGARLDLRFMRRIEPFLRTLESYAGVIEVFCQGFSSMALIWGPIKLMLQLARHYSNVMDKILNAFKNIAGVLPSIDRLKATFGDSADFQRVLGLIYCDLLEFHRRVYKFFRQKGWHMWFAANWGLFERRFKLILDQLDSHCHLLEREATALHFFEMKQMREERERREEEFEKITRSQMVTQVFAWLSAEEATHEEYYHRICDEREPETCDWILHDAQIRPWIEDDNGDRVIWMTGIPGAGKSYLCSFIIQHLETRPEITSLYFFCGHRSSDQSRFTLLLRTLAVQLLRKNLDLALLVHQKYLQKGSNSSSVTMKPLLKEILPSFTTVRIILDGIDEYHKTDQRETLKCLVDLQKLTDSSSKLLISSREIPFIGGLIPHKAELRLGGKTLQGLNLYIHKIVKDLQDYLPEINNALFVRVKERLEQKAKGMFLWVRLVAAMLKLQISEEDFETAIERLPEGLGEAYGQILEGFRALDGTSKERINKILAWLCVTYRPITIHEVADGISLKPSQKILGKRTRTGNGKRDIVDICAPLIEMSPGGSLDLVHFSAKEYLLDEQSGPFIDSAKAHFSIAFSSIVNLTSALVIVPRYREGLTEEELEIRVVQGCYGLQSYAHCFWAEHLAAFLEGSRDLRNEYDDIVTALQSFSKVCKEHPVNKSAIPGPRNNRKHLLQLENYPQLLEFVSIWLDFKSRMDDESTDPEDQKKWRLQNDETFLSLIDYNLRDITDRLLMMNTSMLPQHIDEIDHKAFICRFHFVCRFFGCDHNSDSVKDREIHEMDHLISFPCPQCDFAKRGFKSRKDLQKHTRKYHMAPEDFEIPPNLNMSSESLSNNQLPNRRIPRSGYWSEQGHNDIKRGFQQALEKFESKFIQNERGEKRTGNQLESEGHPVGNDVSVLLDDMRSKIEGRQYPTLAEFRADIHKLSSKFNDKDIPGILDAEAIFEQELEDAMSGFPALANFRRTPEIPENDNALQYGFQDPMLQNSGLANGNLASSVNCSAKTIDSRTTYWSLAEKNVLPSLLERYGRNLIGIADYLKTKTTDEVDQYLSERAELSDLADLTDAVLKSQTSHRAIENQQFETETTTTHDSTPTDPVEGPHYVEPTNTDFQEYSRHPENLDFVDKRPFSTGDLNRSNLGAETSAITTKAKRKPPVKQVCPHCSKSLRDEYTLRKHVDRLHKPFRSVWICNDISIDKKFLGGCRSCSKLNRYRSENGAARHLRLKHFVKETPLKTLHRWMQESKEPNTKFEETASNSSFLNIQSQALDQRETKRQRLGGERLLHKDYGIQNSANILPSIRSSPKSQNGSRHQDSDNESTDSDSTDSESGENLDLFPDVSFDNLLPSLTGESHGISTDGPPHRTLKTLIKLDQVERLPHLEHVRKTACHDQVEAYYQILDQVPSGTPKYRRTFDNLKSLSERLRKEVQEWRQRSAYVPNLPFNV